MRNGFTTGSCAAAAAKAACYMLLSGNVKNEISIETPKGLTFAAEVIDITRQENSVSCAIIKDGGDDPDVTTGAHVFATVSYDPEGPSGEIRIDGGEGVGRVTKPGLDQPIGAAAINHVPREMIAKEVREICTLYDYSGALLVLISIPEGIELAKETFNPRLGIVGGISVLGTSGVVEPMSSQAILDTIRVELSQRRALGNDTAAISPGNYGLDYMKRTFDFDLDQSVKCSNYIGETFDYLVELGFKKVLFTGHIGKLVKLSGGMMNTHSKMGDHRMEFTVDAMNRTFHQGLWTDRTAEEKQALCEQILACLASEEALAILEHAGIRAEVMQEVMNGIMYHLQERVGNALTIECMMYANEFGELARTDGAYELLAEIKDSLHK